MNRSFILGVALGVGGVWAYHRWVRPMSTNASK
jgi:hypothetical protein